MERRGEHRARNRHEIVSNDAPNFDRKLDWIVAGGHPYIKDHLLHRTTRDNCLTIINYVLGLMSEVNSSQDYRLNTIVRLKHLAECYNPKSFRELARDCIVAYLDSFRKPETTDPLHKWIGTYEPTRIMLLRFFRWLNAPDVEERFRPKPAIMANIPRVKRKEISIYKPTDLWTEEDDALF